MRSDNRYHVGSALGKDLTTPFIMERFIELT